MKEFASAAMDKTIRFGGKFIVLKSRKQIKEKR
jgi:hypothetical protein